MVKLFILLLPVFAFGQAFTYRDPSIIPPSALVSLTIPTFVRAGTNSVATGSTSPFQASTAHQTLAITVSAGAGQTVQVSDALASTAASIFMGTQPGAAGSTTETYSASLTGSIMSLVAVALHGQ